MKIKTCLTLALAGVFSISNAVATVLEKLQTSDLAKRASVAVMGEVIDSRSISTDGGFATIATIKVDTALWGTDAATLEVQVLGGQQKIGKYNLGTTIASSPVLLTGAKLILMLTRVSSGPSFTVVGMNQGVLSVVRTAQGDVVLLPGAGKLLPVAAALDEIREARRLETSKSDRR